MQVHHTSSGVRPSYFGSVTFVKDLVTIVATAIFSIMASQSISRESPEAGMLLNCVPIVLAVGLFLKRVFYYSHRHVHVGHRSAPTPHVVIVNEEPLARGWNWGFVPKVVRRASPKPIVVVKQHHQDDHRPLHPVAKNRVEVPLRAVHAVKVNPNPHPSMERLNPVPQNRGAAPHVRAHDAGIHHTGNHSHSHSGNDRPMFTVRNSR